MVITGCCGFIGMNFMEMLVTELENGEIPLCDGFILMDGGKLKGDNFWEWMAHENYNLYERFVNVTRSNKLTLEMIDDDINNLTSYEENKDEVSNFIVLNFASESHVDNSIADPYKVFKENACLVPNLVKFLGISKIAQFIHIRTDEEYGHLTSVDEEPFKTTDLLQPRNPYSASKASQYLFLHSLQETFGMFVVFITLANQFGKYQHDTKMIPVTIKRILSGKKALVYGDGSQIREWTFVEDTVQQIKELMFTGVGNNHISNESGLLTNLELVNMIIDILKEDYNIEGDYEFIGDRVGHDFCYKLESPSYEYGEIKDDLRKTVDFYVKYYE